MTITTPAGRRSSSPLVPTAPEPTAVAPSGTVTITVDWRIGLICDAFPPIVKA